MEEEKQDKTRIKQEVIRNEKGQIIKGTANPYGRPLGAVSFATKWKRFVERVAESEGLTAEQIDEELLMVGLRKAKEGDYNFYRDIHDRVYGRATQPIDHTTGGDKLNVPNEKAEEIAKKYEEELRKEELK